VLCPREAERGQVEFSQGSSSTFIRLQRARRNLWLQGKSGSLAVTVHQQLWMSIRVSLLPKLCLNFLHHKQRERQ